jgi:hypothetical protein
MRCFEYGNEPLRFIKGGEFFTVDQYKFLSKDSSFSNYRVTCIAYPMSFDTRLDIYVLDQYRTCDSFKICGESKEVIGLI